MRMIEYCRTPLTRKSFNCFCIVIVISINLVRFVSAGTRSRINNNFDSWRDHQFPDSTFKVPSKTSLIRLKERQRPKKANNHLLSVLSTRFIQTSLQETPPKVILFSTAKAIWSHIRNQPIMIVCASCVIGYSLSRKTKLGILTTTNQSNFKRKIKLNVKMNTSEVISRAFTVWSRAFPIIVHYRFTQAWVDKVMHYDKSRRDEIYQHLHEKHAPETLDIILQLRGEL